MIAASPDHIAYQDRGFLLADGAFDTLLVGPNGPIDLLAHVRRLADTLGQLGFQVGSDDLRTAITAAAAPPADGAPYVLRTTVTRGVATRGLWPGEWGPPTLAFKRDSWRAAGLGEALDAIVSNLRRYSGSPLTRLKTLSYLENILAQRDAVRRGGVDALRLNEHGRVSGLTTANLFVVHGARVSTPPLDEGVLAGTVRSEVLAALPALGLDVEERPFEPTELLAADLVFATNSVRRVAFLRTLDGRAVRIDPDLRDKVLTVATAPLTASAAS